MLVEQPFTCYLAIMIKFSSLKENDVRNNREGLFNLECEQLNMHQALLEIGLQADFAFLTFVVLVLVLVLQNLHSMPVIM